MAKFRKNVAIDLGTTSILVYISDKGIVLEEPSVIATDVLTGDILACGSEAKKLLGRASGNIKAIKPMKNGVIADFKATERMLKYFLDKAVKKSLLKPDVLICIPSRSTQVEKRAVLEASENAGSHRTYLIEEPLAAAIGAGVDITDPNGTLILDIGGGTCDIAVVSMGQIVTSSSTEIAGNEFDRIIQEYIRKRYGLLIGEQKAENVKIAASKESMEQSIEVTGRLIDGGLPQKIYVPVAEIYNCLIPSIDIIVKGVKKVLEVTPPELSADIFDKEMILTGGSALTLGLKERIEEKLQIQAVVAKNPTECVIDGTSKALTWMDSLDYEKSEQMKFRQSQLENNEKLRRR